MEPSTEQVVADTGFGRVSDRRVTYFYKKGWFNRGNQEDLPIRHITSVRLETRRSIFWGLLFALIGIISLVTLHAAGIVVGILCLAWAALLLWGSPKVVLNTAGGDLRPAVGFPWTKPEANKFVTALRSQLFKDQ